MTYHFNVTGADRKMLVSKISKILGIEKKYLGVPTCAYQIGAFIVSKDGTLSGDEDAKSLIEQLAAEGFPVYSQEDTETMREDDTETVSTAEEKISIAMPRAMLDDAAIENLKRLVASKNELMKRAFQTDDLPIVIDEEKISFPWFSAESSPEEINAYTFFIQRICEMAVLQKRINHSEKEVVNEKYEFRCFLLRLGMIGADSKMQRKILLRNLTGSSAFKNGGKVAAEA